MIGRRAWVHLHLPTRRFSVKVSGQPVFYVDSITLKDCTFHINDRLRAAFEAKSTRRTVHAHVIGEIVALRTDEKRGERVSCNPFAFRRFARSADNATVVAAKSVGLHSDGSIYAEELTVDTETDPRWHRDAS